MLPGDNQQLSKNISGPAPPTWIVCNPRGQIYQCQGSKILVIMREKFRKRKKVNIKEKIGG
jgi:hypothetical protein